MSGEGGGRWDFFVSYANGDQRWAEWVAWQLEAAEYRVLVQAWDFVPGAHWTVGMQEGLTRADRTVAVLSRAYLGSTYGRAEWMAAYREDPAGFARKLIPVRVEDCEQPGLLGQVVSIDVFGVGEDAARTRLLDGIDAVVTGRAKPRAAPAFPRRPPSHAELGWPTSLRPPTPPPVFPGTRPAGGSPRSDAGLRGTAPKPRHADPLDGSDPPAVGPYRLLRRLRATATSIVYLAEGAGGRRVAVKRLHPHLAEQDGPRERFRREVDNSRRVESAYTPVFVDADADADPPHLVTEFIDGPTLADEVADRGSLSDAEARQLATTLLWAMADLHAAGVVHRDLTPANVVLSVAGPRLVDLGTAWTTNDPPEDPGGAGTLGTPRCMAPEQWRGEPATPAVDVFAWGCVVVHAGTGGWPFPGRTREEIRHAVSEEAPRLGGLGPALRGVVGDALAKDPSHRPEVGDLLGRLGGRTATSGVGPVSSADGSGPPPARAGAGTTRRRVLAAVGGVAVAGTATTLGVVLTRGGAGASAGSAFDQANRVAATADHLRTTDAHLARTLDLAAYRLAATPETRAGMLRHAHLATFDDHTGSVGGVAFHPRRQILATAGDDQTVRLRDLAGSRDPMIIRHPGKVLGVAFSPDGRLLASCGTGPSLVLWDVDGLEAAHTLAGHRDGDVISVSFSPAGDVLASGAADGTVRLWHLGDLTAEPVVLPHGSPPTADRRHWVHSVAVSGDDQTLASVGDTDSGPRIKLWRFRSPRQPPTVVVGHFNWIGAVAFSPDGRSLVVVSGSGAVRLFDADSPAHPAEFHGETDKFILCTAFHPDGASFATGDQDAYVRLWETARPDRHPPVGTDDDHHTGAVRTVAFSPDGKTLATGSDDQTVRLWSTDPGDIADRLCRDPTARIDREEWERHFPDIPLPGVCP